MGPVELHRPMDKEDSNNNNSNKNKMSSMVFMKRAYLWPLLVARDDYEVASIGLESGNIQLTYTNRMRTPEGG